MMVHRYNGCSEKKFARKSEGLREGNKSEGLSLRETLVSFSLPTKLFRDPQLQSAFGGWITTVDAVNAFTIEAKCLIEPTQFHSLK